ncbi:MAG TPA: hypothetical protein VNH46_10475 [Gemmatimonadales bacterium]|nr:hypothetical protein [Gemmatimonadales bacterium]
MLTPAEEVGLAGIRLAGRVQRALDAIPPAELAALLRSVQELAAARHLSYQRDGTTETIRLLASPVTLRQDQLGYLHYVSQTILNCLKRLPDLYLSDPAVREILRLEPEEEAWLAGCWTPAHREINPIVARLDAVVDLSNAMWKDTLRYVEPNLTGIGGIHLAPTCDGVLSDLVVPALQARDPTLVLQRGADLRELLLQELLEHLEATGRPNGQIVLVDPKYELDGPDEPESLVEHFRERYGIRVLHADPSELRLRDGEVWYGDSRVDVAYRDYGVLDLIELEREGGDSRPMRALFAGNRMVSSIAAELDQKSCWEVFTDPELARRHLTAEEQQVMRRHLLWTRLVAERRTTTPTGESVDLLPFIRRERETLVLKPNRSYGGEGVTLGPSVSQSQWDDALATALADEDRWVVQQIASIPVREFPLLTPDGSVHREPFYLVMGFAPTRYGVSLVARASQKQVVNVALQGGECGVMIST